MEILEPFLLWDNILCQSIIWNLAKLNQEKSRKKIEMKIYSIILDALFQSRK